MYKGFDLDYVGVIIGKDIFLDDQNEIAINEDYVVAKNDKPVKKDPLYNEKLKRWVFYYFIAFVKLSIRLPFVFCFYSN